MEPTTRRTSEALALLLWLAGQVSHATPSAKDSVREKNSRSHVPLVVCYLHIYINICTYLHESIEVS